VLDLEAGVHLKEVEIPVAVEKELDGAGVSVAGGKSEPDGGLTHAPAQIFVDDGGGGFFEDFLVAALNGALAFAEGYAVAILVGEELNFDVARAFDELFEVNLAGAECAFGFAAGRGKGRGKVFGA
jgi:hypothetical protein